MDKTKTDDSNHIAVKRRTNRSSIFGDGSRLSESKLGTIQYSSKYAEQIAEEIENWAKLRTDLEAQLLRDKEKIKNQKLDYNWDIFSIERQDFLTSLPDLESFKKLAITFLEQQYIIADWVDMCSNNNTDNIFRYISNKTFIDDKK